METLLGFRVFSILRLAVFCALSALLLAAGKANASPPLVIPGDFSSQALTGYMEYLEDPDGKLSIDDVTSSRMDSRFRTVVKNDASFGFSRSAYWMRFTLQQNQATPRTILYELAFPYLDYVSFYQRNPAGASEAWSARHTGDMYPFASREIDYRHPVFSINLRDDQPHTFYVRVQSQGTVAFPGYLRTPQSFQDNVLPEQLLFGLFYGGILSLLLYNLFLYFGIRDPVYLIYTVFLGMIGLLQFSANGLAYQYLWPDSILLANWAVPLFVTGTMTSLILFSSEFLSTRTLAPRWHTALNIVAAGCVLAFVVTGFYGGYPAATRASLMGAMVCLCSVAFAGLVVWRSGFRAARLFFLAFGVEILASLITTFRTFGWVPTNFLTMYGMQVGTAVDAVLLALALADRVAVLKREKEVAQMEALEAATRAGRELEERVQQRTHELNELNDTLREEVQERKAIEQQLRENEQKMRHMAYHDGLTGLPNRILLYDRIAMASAHARRDGHTLALLLIDLDNFKHINDAFGHDAGDTVLRTVAMRLQNSVRAMDTVARLGGDEFVVLLQQIKSSEDSIIIAKKILDALFEPILIAGSPERVTPSIGISMFKPDEDVEGLLKRADTALYKAKNAGRNRHELAPQ